MFLIPELCLWLIQTKFLSFKVLRIISTTELQDKKSHEDPIEYF